VFFVILLKISTKVSQHFVVLAALQPLTVQLGGGSSGGGGGGGGVKAPQRAKHDSVFS
jgi:hypothetical protein